MTRYAPDERTDPKPPMSIKSVLNTKSVTLVQLKDWNEKWKGGEGEEDGLAPHKFVLLSDAAARKKQAGAGTRFSIFLPAMAEVARLPSWWHQWRHLADEAL
jgi:hypothetical protein